MQQSFDFNFTTSEPTLAPVLLKGDKWDTVWSTLRTDTDLNYKDASRGVSLSDLILDGVTAIYQALVEGWTINLGFSGGKDSMTCLHLLLMAIIRAKRNGIKISKYNYLIHTDTRIENPEIRWLADKQLSELEKFIVQEDLPLTIVIAQPGLTSSWTGRILTGRGLPTFSNSSARQCTNELKISSAKRARSAYVRDMPKDDAKRICLILGSRDAESSIRASNIAKKGGHASKVTVTKEGGELYPIRHWMQSDVWEFLLASGSSPRYNLPSFLESNNETAELYKAATGECVWSGSDKRTSDACGSRFGCWACQAVGLDKSMETLLATDDEKHGYMAGLNRIQRLLSKRRYAWEDRHPVGRTIYANGFIKIQPDVYSPRFLERLLHICCSVDYAEQCRADELAIKLLAGEIEDNEHNRRMSNPQFRVVTEQAIIHIDFMWSFHHFNDRPFSALEIYRKVWAEGELDLLEDEPEISEVARTPIPKPVWARIGKFGDGSAFDGLSDPLGEMVYFDADETELAGRIVKTAHGSRRVVSFCEDDEVTIDQEAAEFIIWNEYDRLRESVLAGHYTPGSAAKYYLRFGAVSLCKGKISLYQRMMQRGQTYHRLGLSGFQTMEGISSRKDLRIMTDENFRRQVTRVVNARVARMKYWANMAFTIEYHREQKTGFGLWLNSVIDAEETEKEHQDQHYSDMATLNSGQAMINAWSLYKAEEKPALRNTLYIYWRKTRMQFNRIFEQLSDARKISATRLLLDECNNLVRAIEDGKDLADFPHGIVVLAQAKPASLLNQMCQIRKILKDVGNVVTLEKTRHAFLLECA